MIDQIIILFVLLLLSAFFSGSEIALFSLTKVKITHLVEKNVKGAKLLEQLKSDPHKLLITILIGNNVVNVAASAYATSVAIGMFQNKAIGIVTGVMTFLILVFGELAPKAFATRNNEKVSLFVSRPIWILNMILYPIIKILDWINKIILAMLGASDDKKKPEITEEELSTYVKLGEKEGAIKKSEKDMIQKIFKFNDISVSSIITPKPDMVTIDSDSKIKDHLNFFVKCQYTRIPVYDKKREKIVGILYIKDIMKVLKDKKTNLPIKKVMKTPLFVPESKKVDSLLKHFQAKKQHMAMVVDEHGELQGLVTLEDALEEIVGEIMDEEDKVDPEFVKLSPKSWRVLAKADFEEINKRLKLKIRTKDEFDTLGGFVLSKLGRIPKEKERIKVGKITFIIEKKQGQRIILVKVMKG